MLSSSAGTATLLSVLLVLVVCNVQPCAGQQVPTDGGAAPTLPVMHAGNFAALTKRNDMTLVLFSSQQKDKCPRCGRAEMMLQQVGQDAGRFAGLAVVYVDTEPGHRLLAQHYGDAKPVLPFVALWRDGVFRPYQAPMNPQYLVEFVASIFVAGTPKELVSKSKKDEFNGYKDSVRVVSCFPDTDTPEFDAFYSAGRFVMPRAIFGYSRDCKIVRAYKVKKAHEMVLLRQGLPALTYKGKWSPDAIVRWVEANRKQLVDDFTPEHFQDIANARDAATNVTYVFLFQDSRSPDYAKMLAEMRALAKYASSRRFAKFNFGFFSVEAHRYKGFVDSLGLSAKDLPALLLARELTSQQGKEYKYEEAQFGRLSLRGMKKFLSQWSEGKIERRIKSGEEPAENNGPVHVLTAKSFERKVMESDQTVLMEIWAPWCGHCRKFAPVYKEIGEAFANDSRVLVANYDGQANEVRSNWGVRGYPTVLLFKAGEKDVPIPYEGARTFEDVVDFVKAELDGGGEGEKGG